MPKRAYSFQLALESAEIDDYFNLRKQIFCEEQRLFGSHDRDALDERAYPIVAIAHTPNQITDQVTDQATDQVADQVVGVVRIYEPEPRLWYGGRLGVHPEFRRVGKIGKGLIQTAVTTANTWGCDRFLATVQLQNVRFFSRLHWHSLKEVEILGQPHHLMQADLDYYPANQQQRPDLPIWQVA
jgi:putative N-acetyltransferase (TIGR04045 family)